MCIIASELPESISADWNNRIRTFQNDETVLPPWQIRFHRFVPEETEFQDGRLGESGLFRFYKSIDSYWIFAYNNQQKIAARLTLSYDSVDIFYNANCAQYNFVSNIQTLLCLAYKYRALMNHGLILHSSAIIYRNKAVLFIGDSGAGKSTQAEYWKKYKHAEVLNYDQNYLQIRQDSIVVSSTPWGGKEAYYNNKTATLNSIVLLQRSSDENKIEHFNMGKSFSTIYLHNYIFPFEIRIEESFSKNIKELISRVPVYRLTCTLGLEAVDLLHYTLYDSYV